MVLHEMCSAPGRKGVEQAVGAEENFFIGRIVEEHGDDGVGAQFGFCGRGGGDCAFAEQRFGAALGAVPHGEFVTGSEQPVRHGCAHLAHAQKSDSH